MTDMTPEAGALKRGVRDAPRWMAGLLIGSLALNLLVIGLAAGALWHVRFGQAAGGGNLLGNLVAFSQTLPAARRSELAVLIGDSRPPPELRTLRQDVRATRREVMRQFTADPFDVSAFRAAEAQAAQAESRLREAADGLAAGLAKQLTAAERNAFLKWRELRRGRPRNDADDDRSDKARAPKTP
jgi:uncharacterized membrane protein